MIDPSVAGLLSALTGVLGALGGVGLGARSSRRAQRELLLLTERREDRNLRSDAYTEYLVSHRKLRVFIMIEATDVTVIEAPDLPNGFFALVEGAGEYRDATAEAAARLLLLAGPGSTVVSAATQLHDSIWRLAAARTTYPRGSLPAPLVQAVRQAEDHFVLVAHDDLDRFGQACNKPSARGATRTGVVSSPH